jgi:hypothetical protein
LSRCPRATARFGFHDGGRDRVRAVTRIGVRAFHRVGRSRLCDRPRRCRAVAQGDCGDEGAGRLDAIGMREGRHLDVFLILAAHGDRRGAESVSDRELANMIGSFAGVGDSAVQSKRQAPGAHRDHRGMHGPVRVLVSQRVHTGRLCCSLVSLQLRPITFASRFLRSGVTEFYRYLTKYAVHEHTSLHALSFSTAGAAPLLLDPVNCRLDTASVGRGRSSRVGQGVVRSRTLLLR